MDGVRIADFQSEGGLAYVTDVDRGLVVLDVSDPRNPAVMGSVRSYPFHDLVVHGSFVYATGNSDPIVLDVSDPANPLNGARIPAPSHTGDPKVVGDLRLSSRRHRLQNPAG